ncbi:Type II/IV secretion system protein [Sulfobacillus thermosulfidooxidans DSM 9293]|uniref:Type II/IV secretion system protein n=2 Tax=Sulfobacillus thermosulfidooxidans TaxID=28034 RepID=A0A1W1W6I5_SULTA|nr:Flp pilus assembly complex ATPase component TadA [Sulfobacillus thermosulfidooxidans]SMC01894.1 Type II/IV secretion system protein [Sulfobacillus thermosulfidooxidans DSM 9293]
MTTTVSLSMWDLVDQQILSAETAYRLVTHVRQHHRLLVTGSSGTGKTTLLRALLHESLMPDQSVVIVQPLNEWPSLPGARDLRITGPLTMSTLDLVQTISPDYVIIDHEGDGSEILHAVVHHPYPGLLMTWNTGIQRDPAILKAWDLVVRCSRDVHYRRTVEIIHDMAIDNL